MSSPRPRHPWRLAICAVLVGLTWFGLVSGLEGVLPWESFPMPHGPQLAICLVLGTLLPTFLLHRFLVSIGWRATLPAAVVGFVLGALFFEATFVALSYLGGDSIEEVAVEGTLLGKLFWCALCVLYGTLGACRAAAQTSYVSLPLYWLSILVLRRVSGSAESNTPSLVARTGDP